MDTNPLVWLVIGILVISCLLIVLMYLRANSRRRKHIAQLSKAFRKRTRREKVVKDLAGLQEEVFAIRISQVRDIYRKGYAQGIIDYAVPPDSTTEDVLMTGTDEPVWEVIAQYPRGVEDLFIEATKITEVLNGG